jgi:3-oxo-5-alpha-steroid 4-dehydrogenase 1
MRKMQMMGKTSGSSSLLLPGRITWVCTESLAPLNFLYILYTLPSKLRPVPNDSSSILGTGLPLQHEILAILYVAHYINRAVLTPIVYAPSVSPIAPWVALMMVYFQWSNSANVGCWNVYNSIGSTGSLFHPIAMAGLLLWVTGFVQNVRCEHKLFELRRAAAKRKAKSEGKAEITYEKVYVIPPAAGSFKHILFPHYVWEWVEWAGYWLMGGAWGLGWGNNSAALWFTIAEICVMLPRAKQGKDWYEQKFGKRAVAGRAAALPILGI